MVITQCQRQGEDEFEVDLYIYSHQNDLLALEVAKNLATHLESRVVRSLIKDRVLYQFDGDYNFIVGQEHKTEVDGVVFEEILFGNSKIINRNALYSDYPLLQVAVPELVGKSVEDWDIDKEIPLVAVRPIAKEGSYGKVVAYDSKGKIHYLDVNTEPDKLAVVIGNNERLVGIEKNTNARNLAICEEPLYSDPNYDYYSKDQLDGDPCDSGGSPPGGGGTPPPSNCRCDRDCNTQYSYVEKAKFASPQTLRYYEDWLYGAPELRLLILKGSIESKGFSIISKSYSSGARGSWKDCGFLPGSCETIWHTMNLQMLLWPELEMGDRVKVEWWEEDALIGGNYSTYLNQIVYFRSGDHVAGGLAWRSNGDFTGKRIGNTEVYYCDNTDGLGTYYTVGDFAFYVNQ